MTDASKPQYSVLHITGYTKIWPPSPTTSNMLDQQGNMYHHTMQNLEDPNQALNSNFHLIAIARIQMTSAPSDMVNSSNYEFITRHDQNGLITFVDERVTSLLGHEPSQMLKKNLYEFCIPQDQQLISDQFKQIYESKISQPIQFTLHFKKNNDSYNPSMSNAPNNDYLAFNTSAYAFLNPCNDTFEFIVCTHTSQKYNELSNINSGSTVQGAMPIVNNIINSATSSHLMSSQVDVNNSALSNVGYMQYASMPNQTHYVPHVHQMENPTQQQPSAPVNIQLNYPTQMDPHGYMHQSQQPMQSSNLNSNIIPQNSHYGNYMMMQAENFYGQ
jgi:hypothetical protein